MEFREQANGAAREISLPDLKQGIRSGKLGPKAWLKDGALTGGRWRTLDNTKLFHAEAPSKHPLGEHLVAREGEEGKRQTQQASVAERAKAWAREFETYFATHTVDDAFLQKSLSKLLDEEDVVGVARLRIRILFKQEAVVTLIHRGESVEVLVVRCPSNFRGEPPRVFRRKTVDGSLQETPGAPFNPTPEVVKGHGEVGKVDSPKLLQDWSRFRELALSAKPCERDGYNVGNHEFLLADANGEFSALWKNPQAEDVAQSEILRLFWSVLESVKLSEFAGPNLADMES